MFHSETLPRLIVRLPVGIKDWIAEEAIKGHRSMNSVVIEALKRLMVERAQETRSRKHDAAVSHALASADPSLGACIISKSRQRAHQTELLIQKPSSGELTLFARIIEEHIEVFTDENAVQVLARNTL